MWKIVLWVCVASWGWGGVKQAHATLLYNMDNLTSFMSVDYDDVEDLWVVNYSKPRIANTQKKPLSEFDMRAMGPLYNASYMVIDVIARQQAYPAGIISVSDGHVYVAPLKKEWPKLLYHYAGMATVTAVVAIVIVALPLSGLVWGCCSICRKRRRRRPYDRKYDNCRKGILTLLFIGLLTLFLFGLVCAFSTESQLENSLSQASAAVRRNVDEVQQYLNVTQTLTTWLLTSNYAELEDRLTDMLSELGQQAALRLADETRLSAVGKLAHLVRQLDDMRTDLLRVHNLTQSLRTRADSLNTGLRKVKSQLLQTLAKCDQPKCIALQNKYKIGQLDTEIHYSQMPDVTELVSKVSSLLDTNIKEEVTKGEKVLLDIQTNIQRTVDMNTPDILKSLTDTGRHLFNLAGKITGLTANVTAEVSKTYAVADEMQRTYDAYGMYRQYLGFGTACLLLLIMVVLVWGLLCGVCGKRPDAYGISDCCNKASGTKSLYCGVVLIFAIGWVVAVVFLLYLWAGVAAQRFFCDPLVEPRKNRLFGDLEKLVDLEHAVYKVHSSRRLDMTTVLVMCHQNRTLYEVLQLDRVLDVDVVRSSVRSDVARGLDKLRPALAPRGQKLVLLTPRTRGILAQLAESGLDDFDFDRIISAMETNMTTLALGALSQQLYSTVQSLQQPTFRAEARDLRAAADELHRLNEDTLVPMLLDANALNETALRLQTSRRWLGRVPPLPSHPALPALPPPPDMIAIEELVGNLVDTTEEAERLINDQGPALLDKLMKQYSTVVKDKVDSYLQLVREQALLHVGHCGPLSAAFNSTRDVACRRILMPVNGYWMSLGWCMLLYIPLMVVAIRLARLYLHADPYPGPLVEAEYLYDAYADRDNVPLANAYKVEKRTEREAREGREVREGREGRGRGREAEGREGREAREGRGGSAGPAMAAPLDAYHARRYNDMAPKHWEEGPPRYHGPTEYERPPPYYYPGPNDRQ